jgi:methylisocitrate lyase
MSSTPSPGDRFRAALQAERPLQIVGTIHAYNALQARHAGFRAVYLSGAGVANASHGLPDLGLTTPHDVETDARRIASATDLPLLVDADTGWGGGPMIERAVRTLQRAGAAGLHLEDQVEAKRCGHRPGKRLVSAERMAERVRAAVEGRLDPGFVIMARTDAPSVEGLDAAIERARRYLDAGAEMIFVEALEDRESYRRFCAAVDAPVLANLTEFGRTPLLGLDQLREAGVAMALYPLSAFRAMSAAAERVYHEIRQRGTQEGVLPEMQTRDELYDRLHYEQWERRFDTQASLEEGEGTA